ncbi:hypothetical protein AHAS_Ahas03G0144900 [Arachis hypogaea]
MMYHKLIPVIYCKVDSIIAKNPKFTVFLNSMDCGVWVAQWMIREHLWKEDGGQHVNSATRMYLAMDLVLKSHNRIAQEVVTKAFARWQRKSL